MSGVARLSGWFLVLLAGGWLVFEAMRPPPALPDPAVPAEPVPPGLPELAPDAPLLSEFKTTLERPLFQQDRRPDRSVAGQDATPDEQEAGDSGTDLRLSAVIVDADGRSALLSTPQQPQARRVPVGGTIAGWRVDEIRDDAVLLRSGTREAEIALRTFGPARPPVPQQVEPGSPNRAARALLRRRPVRVAPGLEVDEPIPPGEPDFEPPQDQRIDD